MQRPPDDQRSANGATTGLRIYRTSPVGRPPKGWDSFVAACDGTLELSWRALRRKRLGRLGQRLELLVVEAAEHPGERVAQCAWARTEDCTEIIGSLLVAKPWQDRWCDIAAALLAAGGPGRYRYGGHWSTDRPREHELASLPGLKLEHVSSYVMQAIDFSRWPNWDVYWRKVSDSVRYEAKTFARAEENEVRVLEGLGIIPALPRIIAANAASYRAKGLAFSPLVASLRHLSRVTLCAPLYEAGLATSRGKVSATYFGGHFGRLSYYLHGGLTTRRGGANWALLETMVRRAYQRHPDGWFLMGTADVHGGEADQGLIRARRALRVTDVPTSLVEFVYAP